MAQSEHILLGYHHMVRNQRQPRTQSTRNKEEMLPGTAVCLRHPLVVTGLTCINFMGEQSRWEGKPGSGR